MMNHREGMMFTEIKNNHVIGITERITTEVIAGWCGIDFREKVTFDLNTCGTLRIDIEGRKYLVKDIKKRDVKPFMRWFLAKDDDYINHYYGVK